MTGDIENQLTVLKETGKQKNNVANGRFNVEVSYFLVITLAVLWRSHKLLRTDRGAENPTGPKLPDFSLSEII